MDENLLKDEMAATAFSQLITKMATNTAQFAEFAGMKVADFTKLVKEDLNGAILALADNLKKQDASTLLNTLNSMKMDGTRAVGVLANLADKIDDGRKHQQTANAAYAEGTSVINEFAVMNDTVEARLDKVKKQFQEMTIELGSRLQPIVQYTISSVGLLTKAMNQLVNFVVKYQSTLMTLTVTIGMLVLKKEADVLITKAQIIWNEKLVVAYHAATAACKRLWAAIAANPYTAAAAAGMVLLGVMVDLLNRAKETNKAESDLADIRKNATTRLEEQRSKTEMLIKASKDENLSLDEKLKAINELQRIIPGYISNLDAKTGKYRENKQALDDYNASLMKMYELEGAKEILGEIGREIADVTVELNDAKDAAEQAANFQRSAGRSASGQAETMFLNQNTSAAENRVKESNARLQKLLQRRQKLFETYGVDLIRENSTANEPTIKDVNTTPSGGADKKTGNTTKTDPYTNDLKALETAYKQRQLVIKEQLADGLITEREYQERSFLQEMEFLQSKVELQEKYGKDSSDTQISMLDKTMAQARLAQERSAKQMQADLSAAEDAYQSDLTELLRARANGTITTEQEYQERRKEVVRDYLRQRLDIVRQYGGDTAKEEQAVLQQQLDDADEFKKLLKKVYEDAYSHADTYNDQRDILRAMYSAQLIDAQEYQDRLTEMEEEENSKRAAIRKLFYQQAQELLNNYSQYVKTSSDLEVARITANYEKQIEAAGSNSKKRERLEKERDEKIRKEKTKANKKAMIIEMAQATATNATNALSAFGAVLQPEMPWTVPLAYAAASAAAANGLLQIATIKKQHQAEEAGYYEGGFTGGKRYRKEAGVVHEGEFVANHEAVQNRNILPMLELIDQAQRANRVGSLTAEDLSRVNGQAPTVVAPVVNVTTDNTELRDALADTHSVLDRLTTQLEQGIGVDVPIDGENGLYKKFKRYESLIQNP